MPEVVTRRRISDFLARSWVLLLVAVLAVWVVAFGAGLLDMLFQLGWFPSNLDRMLQADIDKLGSADEKVRLAAEKELIDYNQFSVPVLLREMQKGNATTRANCALCLGKIAERYFGEKPAFGEDTAKWQAWWSDHKL